MIVQTSVKSDKPKKTALEYEDFIAMVDSRVKSLCFDYCLKNNKMEISNKVKTQFEKQVAQDIESRFRVKGTRSGHINNAPIEIQDKFNSLKEQVQELEFSHNGEDFVCTILCKKASPVKETK